MSKKHVLIYELNRMSSDELYQFIFCYDLTPLEMIETMDLLTLDKLKELSYFVDLIKYKREKYYESNGILIKYINNNLIQYMLIPNDINCHNKYDPNTYLCSICEFSKQCIKE